MGPSSERYNQNYVIGTKIPRIEAMHRIGHTSLRHSHSHSAASLSKFQQPIYSRYSVHIHSRLYLCRLDFP